MDHSAPVAHAVVPAFVSPATLVSGLCAQSKPLRTGAAQKCPLVAGSQARSCARAQVRSIPVASAFPGASPKKGVVELRSPAALQASVNLAAEVPLSVVGFTRQGCRACRYARRAYKRVADKGLGAAFFEVDINAPGMQEICRNLDVQAVPSWGVFAADENGTIFEVHRAVGPRSVAELDEVVRDIVENGFDPDLFEEA